MSKAVSRTDFEFLSESVVSSQNVLMPQFSMKPANRSGTSRIMAEITITSQENKNVPITFELKSQESDRHHSQPSTIQAISQFQSNLPSITIDPYTNLPLKQK